MQSGLGRRCWSHVRDDVVSLMNVHVVAAGARNVDLNPVTVVAELMRLSTESIRVDQQDGVVDARLGGEEELRL